MGEVWSENMKPRVTLLKLRVQVYSRLDEWNHYWRLSDVVGHQTLIVTHLRHKVPERPAVLYQTAVPLSF